MTQPSWVTVPGDLGKFPSGSALNIEFIAQPVSPAVAMTYKLLSGELPPGNVTLTSDGFLIGSLTNIGIAKSYMFTIRATDNLGRMRDGTFTITIQASKVMKITRTGKLFDTFDSEYVSFKIPYDNPVSTNQVLFRISAGKLPTGLTLTTDGLISGWPAPPTLADKSPTSREFTFSVTASSDIGTDTAQLSIVVVNRQTSSIFAKRNPVITNRRPLEMPIDPTDPYAGYYLSEDQIIETAVGEYFAFKVIGHDFDKDEIEYIFSRLPNGLTGDRTTGWITGIPTDEVTTTQLYSLNVFTRKTIDNSYQSLSEKFLLKITAFKTEAIQWVTPENLGTYHNGTICDLKIKAKADASLVYKVTKGSLPPNISLTSDGELVGRFPFQPERKLKTKGEISTFTFDVTVTANSFYLTSNTRTFTLKIEQRFANPVESVYFKVTPNIESKKIINNLLASERLIPTSFLYRKDDPYFGKAKNVRINHQVGIVASNVLTYLSAIPNNHYRQKFVFSKLKTAVARDDNGEIIYEVVYAELLDPATNKDGVSVAPAIAWPHDIGLRYGDWYDSRTDKFTSSTAAHTSFSPGYVKLLTPVSFQNMRKEIEANMAYDYDQSLLPRWMTTQQQDGSTLGFTEAWVICHTIPGRAEIVKNLIDTYWEYRLSDIDVELDRFIIDRSATYNWNTTVETSVWNNLPSGYPTPDQLDKYDEVVLFNRETILPKT